MCLRLRATTAVAVGVGRVLAVLLHLRLMWSRLLVWSLSLCTRASFVLLVVARLARQFVAARLVEGPFAVGLQLTVLRGVRQLWVEP